MCQSKGRYLLVNPKLKRSWLTPAPQKKKKNAEDIYADKM